MEKRIQQLEEKNNRLNEQLAAAQGHPKSTPEIEKRIQQLEEENNQLKRQLLVIKETPNAEPETAKQIQKLQEEKDVLTDELKMLRKQNTALHKEVDKVDQDGVSKNMAKVLKRYYEMEEQFGQMNRQVKKDLEALQAENGQIQAENEQKIQRQVEDRLTENKEEI
jgi:flagellar biosynthesis GTPase FlhF